MMSTMLALALMPPIRVDLPDTVQQVQELSVDEILQKWEAATRFDTLQVRFECCRYDETFRVKSVSTGMFTFQAPNLGRYVSEPSKAEFAELIDSGIEYKIRPIEYQNWEWLGTKLVGRDSTGRVFSELSMRHPTTAKSPRARWLMKPQCTLLVAHVGVDGLAQQFKWRYVKRHPKGYWLEATPQTPEGERISRRYQVIINPVTFRTYATEYMSPSGSMRTVHVLRDYCVDCAPVQAPKPQ